MDPITGKLILPPDVELTRVEDIEPSRLSGIECEATDWILTRPTSRARSSVVNDELALVLERFRGGARIVDVVIEAARRAEREPRVVLDELWPALTRFIAADWLVPDGSPLATQPRAWYPPGASLRDLTFVRCLSVLDDSQVYQARSRAGSSLAVKVANEAVAPAAGARLVHEAEMLTRLEGEPTPAVVDLIRDGDRRALILEWCPGMPIARAAESLRDGPASARTPLCELLIALLDAYASIHARGVLHGDVHPNNVIVDGDGTVRLIDFGLARLVGASDDGRSRGGVPEFMDPELARQLLGRMDRTEFDPRSEQYSLAALCHQLITGRPYLAFPTERADFLRAVAEEEPTSFRDHGLPPWPAVEQVLARGLAKDAQARFGSVQEMAEALERAAGSSSDEPWAGSPHPAPWSTPFVERVDERLRPDGELYANGVSAGSRASLMTGAAGIGYYVLRAAIREGSPALLPAADQWVEQADRWADEPRGIYDESGGLTPDLVGAVSPYHTRSGVEVLRGLVADARGDVAGLSAAAHRFVEAVDRPTPSLDPTLGRTSVVVPATLLVRALRHHPDQPEVTAEPLLALEACGSRILESVWGDAAWAIGYSGVAHGWAGILYATLVWAEVVGTPLPPHTERRLDALAACAVAEGRGAVWPVRMDGSDDEVMRGWCHGAAGHVHLWNAAHRLLGDSRYADLATRAAWSTFDNAGGGISLCCGEAGRVFALLNMYRHSGDAEWVQRATRCLARARPFLDAPGDRGLANSLYRGELGLALAIREAEQPDDAEHPFFEPPAH